MSFSSLPFLFVFFPIFFILYYLLPARVKTVWLLLGSLIFYYWGCREAPWQLGLMCLMVLVNFCLGHVIGRSSHPKPWLVVGLLFNFLPLVWFKYFAFFGNTLLSLLTLPAVLETKSLPLGLSFFAFQAAAYLVDVYRRSVLPERSLIRAGAYFLLFPHVGSGPILDYRDTAPQLINPTVRLYMVDRGLREFCIGLSLKLLLADRVGKLWQDVAAIGYESISTPLAWMALFAYTFELYLDFYGYSRMAVGLGWMLGLELPRNFSSLRRFLPHGVLAAVAYQFEHVVSQLPLHPLRRQPKRHGQNRAQSSHRVACHRPLARRQLQLSPVGSGRLFAAACGKGRAQKAL